MPSKYTTNGLLIKEGDRDIAITVPNGTEPTPQTLVDADRIVSALNATAGIPDAKLKLFDGLGTYELIEYLYGRLRDDHEALERITAVFARPEGARAGVVISRTPLASDLTDTYIAQHPSQSAALRHDTKVGDRTWAGGVTGMAYIVQPRISLEPDYVFQPSEAFRPDGQPAAFYVSKGEIVFQSEIRLFQAVRVARAETSIGQTPVLSVSSPQIFSTVTMKIANIIPVRPITANPDGTYTYQVWENDLSAFRDILEANFKVISVSSDHQGSKTFITVQPL